jgi:hypothetical protein
VISHFFLMVVHAFLVGLFFAGLWRRDPRARVKLFFQIFLGMVLGGLAVAYLMYPFPGGPPAPAP